jgi:nitroreductase
MDLASVDELLTTTRAVRKRLDFDRPVPPEVIEECLELALQAPTGGNRQIWRWVVVTDQDKKVALAELYRKAYFAYRKGREGEFDSMPEDLAAQTRRVIDSATFLAENLERAPLYVIPCGVGRPGADAPAYAWSSVMGSILPAVWSFQLALRSRGLGSALTTLHAVYEQDAAQILGIPDDVVQTSLLPVAYTKGTDFRPAKRRPAREITYWNTWKSVRGE